MNQAREPKFATVILDKAEARALVSTSLTPNLEGTLPNAKGGWCIQLRVGTIVQPLIAEKAWTVANESEFDSQGASTVPPRAQFIVPNFSKLPQALRDLPRWLTWAAEGAKGEKPTKVPYDPTLPNSRASPTDPATWGTFEQAQAAFLEGGRAGIGFVLNDDGIVGVDLDHCVENGVPAPAALELLENLGATYVELSPSGTGLRAFGYAESLEKGCSGKYGGLNVELYSTKRFLTVTGAVIVNGEVGPLQHFKELADFIRGDRMVKTETGAVERVRPDERHADLIRRILTGDVYHDSLRDLAASFVAQGTREDAVVNHLRALMQNSAAPRDARWNARMAEIPKLVSSAAAKYAPAWADVSAIVNRNEPSRNGVQVEEAAPFSLAASNATVLFAGKSKPVNWLVRGVFPTAKTIILASPPGIGKSFLALDLAVAVASEPSLLDPKFCFGGRVEAHGRAVIISAEDDVDELHRRLESLTDLRPDWLHVASLPDLGHFTFLRGDTRTGFEPTPKWSDLKSQIATLGDVKLVVVDTLQALSVGDLNAAEIAQAMMNELVDLANVTGAAVIALHHLTKSSSNNEKGPLTAHAAMDAIRGSGAIAGSARAAYCLFPHPDGQDICDKLGIEFEENKVCYGLVAKANGQARRERRIYVRSSQGVLQDRTHEYNRAFHSDVTELEDLLLIEITKAHAAGKGFAVSIKSESGLHKRRHEMHDKLRELKAKRFVDLAKSLVNEGKVGTKVVSNGQRYVPLNAQCSDAQTAHQDAGIVASG